MRSAGGLHVSQVTRVDDEDNGPPEFMCHMWMLERPPPSAFRRALSGFCGSFPVFVFADAVACAGAVVAGVAESAAAAAAVRHWALCDPSSGGNRGRLLDRMSYAS